MHPEPALFEQHQIRRTYDEATGTWWFAVIDILQVLIQQPDYQAARKYWKVLKGRMAKEGSQVLTDCYQLKFPAADGRQRLTDVATAETLLRLVQSVPSPKAERGIRAASQSAATAPCDLGGAGEAEPGKFGGPGGNPLFDGAVPFLCAKGPGRPGLSRFFDQAADHSNVGQAH
jgi:hypothetical protein